MIRLKELRESRNIEQKTLAIDLRVSQPTVSDWESGKKTPSIENLVRLADYFQVSIDYLIRRSDIFDTPNAAFLSSTFISFFSEILDLSSDFLIPFVSEMSVEDIKLFFTPAICIPAEPRYRLKRARFAMGLRQIDLAKKLGIPCSEYREYESGEKPFTLKMFISLPTLLNVNPDWLCCITKYTDSQTGQIFDPGDYKPFLDAIYDPIEQKMDILEICNPHFDILDRVRSIQELPEFCQMIKRLDTTDLAEIRGEVKQMLKAHKYNSISSTDDERLLEIMDKAPADMTDEEFDLFSKELRRQSLEEKKQALQASSALPSAGKLA